MWKKYLWVKNLIFLCLASYLLARIGNTLLLDSLNATSPSPSRTQATRDNDQKAARKTSVRVYRSISEKNVFNSANQAQDDDGPQERKPVAEAALQKTDMNVQLIGTVVGSSQSSFAIVEDPIARKQELFRIDDMIQDQARLIAVSRCRVVLLREGREEILECQEEEPVRGKTISPVRPGESSSGDESVAVRKLSENEYVIDRRTLANELSDYNKIMTQVGIGPNLQGTKQDGLRVLKVRPNSFWDKAGLKRGDVIRSVNDLELSTVDGSMRAFEIMRRGEDVTMEISRGGTPRSLHWEIE
jgi:type II secretion system protein C